MFTRTGPIINGIFNVTVAVVAVGLIRNLDIILVDACDGGSFPLPRVLAAFACALGYFPLLHGCAGGSFCLAAYV